MHRTPNLALAAVAALALGAGAAGAGQGDVTPRKDIDPWDRAKVTGIEAQRWTRAVDAKRTATVTGTIPGKQSCITSIGPASPPDGKQPRYGPQQKSSVVVVTGSVINVCR